MESITTLTLDMAQPGDQVVYAVKGDGKSRKIAARLFRRGEPLNLDRDALIIVEVLKPDGKRCFYDDVPDNTHAPACSVSYELDGDKKISVVTFLLVPQATAAVGKARVALRLYQGGSRAATFAFVLDVRQSAEQRTMVSEDYIHFIYGARRKAMQAQAAITEVSQTATQAAYMDAAYPVGTVYCSASSTNPATTLGIGTWTAIQDRFLVGAGGYYAGAATGGAATEAVDLSSGAAMIGFSDAAPGEIRMTRKDATFVPENAAPLTWGGAEAGAAANPTAIVGSATLNKLPPYLAVYMWRRTA